MTIVLLGPEGGCDTLQYQNTIQSEYGYHIVDMNPLEHRLDDDGGYCYGESKNGNPRCVDAEYWERTYHDRAACDGLFDTQPQNCDHRGTCVNVNGVPGYTPYEGA